jgi:Cu/Ag efflux pump CusA
MFSFVGIILLVGLVKKNGIMMVDFSLTLQREKNLPAEQAIVEACLVPFRPIMMTTMAAILATLPIALGYGARGEARQPLGTRSHGCACTPRVHGSRNRSCPIAQEDEPSVARPSRRDPDALCLHEPF